MPVWLSFFLSGLVTIGILFGFFAVLQLAFSSKRPGSRPKMRVLGLGEIGKLGVSVHWQPKEYAPEFYRVVLTYQSPDSLIKEGRMTVTFDSPQKESFFQPFTLSSEFVALVQDPKARAIVSVSVKTAQETPLENSYRLSAFKKLLQTRSDKPKGVVLLAEKNPDHPATATLDFSEIQAMKQKYAKFESEVKAKQAKKPVTASAPAVKAEADKEALPADKDKKIAETTATTKKEPPSSSAKQPAAVK